MGSRRERATISIINWLLKHGTSPEYQQHLERAIKLGLLKARELHLQREIMDARLANEPGIDPITGQTVDAHGNPLDPGVISN